MGNSIIAGNTAPTTPNISAGFVAVGANLTSGDPLLDSLRNNGGPTFTHMPLPGSPALDAGDNAVAAGAGLTTDQRGTGFARTLDAADAGTTQTVDIGAVEADPTLPLIGDQTINEDGSVPVTFNVGDAATAFDAITAVSGDATLLPNLPANVALSGTGSTRTLTLTPAANLSGSSIVTVTATKTVGGVLQTAETSFTLTVNSVNDPPTLDAIANPAAILEDAPQQTINLDRHQRRRRREPDADGDGDVEQHRADPEPDGHLHEPERDRVAGLHAGGERERHRDITVTVTDAAARHGGPDLYRHRDPRRRHAVGHERDDRRGHADDQRARDQP